MCIRDRFRLNRSSLRRFWSSISVIRTGSAKVKVNQASTPRALSSFQSVSGSPSIRCSGSYPSEYELASTDAGKISTVATGAVVAVDVVVEESATPLPPRNTLKISAARATNSTTAPSTPRALPPGEVRRVGAGATGSGSWLSRAPHCSQCRLYSGLAAPHDGHVVVGTP